MVILYKNINGVRKKLTVAEVASYNKIQEEASAKELDVYKEVLIASRKKYLQDTDFRVLRFIDEGLPYPDDIKIRRIEARQEINQIEAAASLEESASFNPTFK